MLASHAALPLLSPPDASNPTKTQTRGKVLDFGPQVLSSLSRSMRAALGFLYGTWYLPLPRPRPIYMVVGKPIPVPRLPRDDPKYEEVINEVHKRVCDALQQMYDDHKAEYGWADRPLMIN
ncbi:hypothetical protein Vretifemale_20740 [Volvox reticuliferus]|uniref:Uncharacterized protein n=1 Tax=Volvox reticuliferus TaxID=1737510 RepID=A0A8J4FWK0_9CHLO|nr:hypothetical protein Vretifemale_20740 [Volvox reticuliferus]